MSALGQMRMIAGYKIAFSCFAGYASLVILSSLIIRVIMGVLRVTQAIGSPTKVSKNRWKRKLKFDFRFAGYVVPFLVGTLELAIYPILISLGSWQAITAWIGLKIANSWRWQQNADRRGYTNFLFGNALVIFAAFCLSPLVTATKP